MLTKFTWWLREEGESERLEELSSESIRFFLAYLRGGTSDARWGGVAPDASRPARLSTVDTYYRCLRAFFNFAVREGLLTDSPMRTLKPPRVPKSLSKKGAER
jgi:site-specific recombinase XerD